MDAGGRLESLTAIGDRLISDFSSSSRRFTIGFIRFRKASSLSHVVRRRLSGCCTGANSETAPDSFKLLKFDPGKVKLLFSAFIDYALQLN